MKKEERKKQIKAVAIRLMSENGYAKTSIDSILKEIKYSKSGFYHCFSSKEELFKEIFLDSINLRYKNTLNLKGLSKKDFLIESFVNKIADYNEYKKLFSKLMVEISTNENFSKLYYSMIDEAMLDFDNFCKENNLEEFMIFQTEEMNVFLSSLIIGVDCFNKYDDENYKAFLREIITAYFENKKLI